MKKYYSERNGLLSKKLELDLYDLLQYFRSLYRYFENKGCFEYAQNGASRNIPYTCDQEQIAAPSFIPTPEVYFANVLQDKEVWPIWQYVE